MDTKSIRQQKPVSCSDGWTSERHVFCACSCIVFQTPNSKFHLLLRPGGGAEYCDQPVCLCVWEHISGTAGPIFTIFCADPMCSWFGFPLTALPVLWVTLRLAFMDRVALAALRYRGGSDVYECVVSFVVNLLQFTNRNK